MGYRQGPPGQAAVVVARVSAPPTEFVISVPNGWVKPAGVVVSWQPAASAEAPLRYQAVLDGRPLATPVGAMQLALSPRGLGDGSHRVQVLATDIDGAATLTPPATLRVDGRAPTAAVTRGRRHSVTVGIRDAGSGVDSSAVTISFGDGQHGRRRGRYHHRYAHAGVYQITVHVRDKVGNQATLRQLVNVR